MSKVAENLLTKGRLAHGAIALRVLATLFLVMPLGSPNLARGEPSCTRGVGRDPLVTLSGPVLGAGNKKLVEITTSTVYCMSCHDGTVAQSLLIHEASAEDKSDPGKNHPVDVAYPVKSTQFMPIELLDEKLVLENGLVTCTTCHAVSSQEVQFPEPLEASRLCLSCHLK